MIKRLLYSQDHQGKFSNNEETVSVRFPFYFPLIYHLFIPFKRILLQKFLFLLTCSIVNNCKDLLCHSAGSKTNTFQATVGEQTNYNDNNNSITTATTTISTIFYNNDNNFFIWFIFMHI